MEPKLKNLQIEDNESESFRVGGKTVAVRITTGGVTDVELQTSIDGAAGTFQTNANFSESFDGTIERNLDDFVSGQYMKIVATSGTLSAVKILG